MLSSSQSSIKPCEIECILSYFHDLINTQTQALIYKTKKSDKSLLKTVKIRGSWDMA